MGRTRAFLQLSMDWSKQGRVLLEVVEVLPAITGKRGLMWIIILNNTTTVSRNLNQYSTVKYNINQQKDATEDWQLSYIF